jgi:3-deoxy-D-manno-octulosonic-acid transferase
MGMDLPGRNAGSRRLIWVHALSVGETLSVVPLVEALKDENPEAEIAFSCATEAGMGIARQRLTPWVETFFYLPHDFPLACGMLTRRLKPDLFVLVETDLWPNLLASLKRRGAVTALVNARLSPNSFRRLNRLKPLAEPVARCLTVVFAQSVEDKRRFEALGIPPERVMCEGNLKFDSALAAGGGVAPGALRESAGIEEGRTIWIAGSTHEGEEEPILRTHKALMDNHMDILLILAPRQVRRRDEIVSLCKRYGLSVAVRSTGETAAGKTVYLLDTMGELGAFYAIAHATFIGGSLVPFGGHNPLEAVVRGTPAVWGPHLFNFREIETVLLDAPGCRRVASPEELLNALSLLLSDRTRQSSGYEAMRGFIEPHLGAGMRIARFLSVYGVGPN